MSSCISLLALSACKVIEPATDRPESHALTAPASSPLRQTATRVQRGEAKDKSNFLIINSAHEALLWRLALVDSATTAIDIQTFLWGSDYSGALLFDRIIKAAERGVRIRLLVDDIWLKGNDQNLASLSQHPSFKIRLYNPSRVRNSTWGQAFYFITNYRKMNRRMHNKTFIADGVMSIQGGRNIGDHYFGLDKTYNFRDLDVIATGPVLKSIKRDFDIFWNSSDAYPAEQLAESHSVKVISNSIRKLSKEVKSEASDKLSSYPTQHQSWESKLSTLSSKMIPGKAVFISDLPDKYETSDTGIVESVSDMLLKAKKEIFIVSPYFIPYQLSFDKLIKLREKGVTVRILVPSLGANNHTPAHSHYRKYRKKILEAGFHLHEYNSQPSQEQRNLCDVDPVRSKWIGMHLKTFIVDRRYSFIGSLNLDPRAMNINTEAGLIIDSPQLGEKLASHIDEILKPENSWEIILDEKGRMTWKGNEAKALRRQPARGGRQRLIDTIARWLPIEKEL